MQRALPMITEKVKHTQQTLLALGDEFLVQYFLCAHREFLQNQILSRLFSMGHSLELYVKAALVDASGVAPQGHDVPSLLVKHDPTLALTAEEVAAGESLFDSDVANVDLKVWVKHAEALELYQAEYFLRDLKYYFNKDGRIIYPARRSLAQVNSRYLRIVRKLRQDIPHRDRYHDQALVTLIGHLGFEVNPALQVVDDSRQAPP